MNKIMDTIIIGAGASGLFLATLLNINNNNKKSLLLLEHNIKVASKLLISGGGKCNVTNKNIKSKNYLGEQKFIAHILKKLKSKELLFWLSEKGLTLELRENGQYFCENSATEIVKILKQNILTSQLKLNTKIERVDRDNGVFRVFTNDEIFYAKRVVVASGGLSFPKIGATSIGYDIATSFGHTVNKLSAGLVGLTLQPEQFFFKSLSGISTNVEITVGDKVAKGALLFAHKGISGPAVLDTSLYWDRGKISINFLPNINLEELKQSKKKISNLLKLPNRLSKALFIALNIEDKIANRMRKNDWEKLEMLQNYTFSPAGTFGYSKAEVTKGGISTDEIDVNSMMSQKVENLFFVGEVLDVTGELGGYNFHWAFSSAFVCAEALKL